MPASARPHGSRARYVHPDDACRCVECRAANAQYMRGWRAQTPGYLLNKRITDRPPHLQARRRARNGTRSDD